MQPKRERILIVDDLVQNIQYAQGILAHAGYEVSSATRGQEALTLFAQAPFDLVLLDVRMPEMDGFEVSRKLRELPQGRFTPIVFLTALEEASVQQKALQSGGDDLLNKPIQSTELLMRVRSLLWISRLRREMQEGYDLIQAQRNDLLRMQRQKQDLMSLIVHDLKNPLTAIMANASFLLQDVPEGEANASARDIHQSAEAMFRLVTNLLDVSRSEDGALVLERSKVDLRALIQEVVQGMRRRFEDEGRTCKLELPEGDLAPIDADPELLSRVLMNLLDNSLKYSPRGSEICVQLQSAEEGWRSFRVADLGRGIPEADRERVFEKFGRLADHGSAASRTSHGLGLTFCRMVVEAHGGTIRIEDNLPRGAAFCVRLPVARP